MKHYTIVMVQRTTYSVEVIAENEEEAYDMAIEDGRTIDNIVDSTLDWIDVESYSDCEEEGEENGED